MQVFFRDYGSAMISAIVGILLIPLIVITLGTGFSVKTGAGNETKKVSIIKSHHMVLNKNSYKPTDESDLKLKLNKDYFTIKKGQTTFSSTTKIINYLKSKDYLKVTGDVDEWETSSFNNNKLGIFEVKITAKNNETKETAIEKIYVKVIA